MSKNNASVNTINGVLEYRQYIVTPDDSEGVQVRYKVNPELYKGTGITLFSYQAKEGKGDTATEVTRYAVAVADAIKAPRASKSKEQVATEYLKAQLANGVSAEELLASLSQ